MLSPQELSRLAALKREEGILSVYIRIDPRLMYERNHALASFKGALKRFSRRVKEPERLAVVEREQDEVIRFLEGWRPSGRGLVIFTCRPGKIWETLTLDAPVPTFVHVNSSTNTAPLAEVLDEYPRFVVALVQRDKAAIYVAEQRRTQDETSIASDVPGQHDQGGWSQARFQRHVEFHFERHLKSVAEQLEKLYQEQPFNRLAIGGTEEVTSELVKMLHDQIARRVIGTFPVDFKHETEVETLRRARRVWEEYERQSERELVESAVNAAKSGRQGAVGIDDTVRAVFEERVHTLLVADGVTKEGAACTSCDYFAPERFDRCPVCGGASEEADDIVERAVEKAYLSGAQVEAVFDEARSWLLGEGGLAALLRY